MKRSFSYSRIPWYGVYCSVPSSRFTISVCYHNICCTKYLRSVVGRGFVNKSAKFSLVCTFAILITFAATLFQTRIMELCFLLHKDVGTVELVTTDLLSQKTFDGPSIGMPNICNLYLNASILSTAILSVTIRNEMLMILPYFAPWNTR
jgi:hypothetical protein